MMRIAASALLAAASAGFAATDNIAAPTANGDKVVCKRVAHVGTLVGAKKLCKTKAEWDGKPAAQPAAKTGE